MCTVATTDLFRLGYWKTLLINWHKISKRK